MENHPLKVGDKVKVKGKYWDQEWDFVGEVKDMLPKSMRIRVSNEKYSLWINIREVRLATKLESALH